MQGHLWNWNKTQGLTSANFRNSWCHCKSQYYWGGPSRAPSDLSRITTEQSQEGMNRRWLRERRKLSSNLVWGTWEVFPGNSDECGERAFVSTPPVLPKGIGILLAFGGKIQGKLAATVQKPCHPLSFDGFRLCNDIYRQRSAYVSILSLQKESSCLGENCRAKRWWWCIPKGLIHMSKEKGGHLTKTSFA